MWGEGEGRNHHGGFKMNNNKRALIVAKGVEKVYSENGVPVPALRGVDLAIETGEFTALVGPSGSGKTTLLNVLSGLDRPTSGDVHLDGRSIAAMSPGELSDFRRDHIGFIFQAYNLIPVLTAEENIEYIMYLQKVPHGERHRRVLEILDLVGMKGLEKRMPPKLSGGQQQRVAIARAMVSRPLLILADEPTANLDSKTGSDLLDIMCDLNHELGMTFVFSTHDKMIMEKAHRVITLKDGKVSGDEIREG
jgi:putative ABC transport system ATP-binding protein